jgi:hypothetical protein
MRQGDDFDCKIVVTTWWLGAKTWLFDGGFCGSISDWPVLLN